MVYITAVHMSDGGTRLQHIESVRWLHPDSGKVDHSPRAAMVEWIDTGGDARVKSLRGDVPVEVVRATPPFLRTAPNNLASDNLLTLPRY